MSHLSEEQLTFAYYGDVDTGATRHLEECPGCRANFEQLKELLDSLGKHPVPERSALYGAEVWTRLLPQLSASEPRRSWAQSWRMAPALAALIVIAFAAGVFVQRQRQALGTSPRARERVLLITLNDYLERSQIVLTEVANAGSSPVDLSGERERARDLLGENSLLRAATLRTGNTRDALLLDDLERVLLDVANSFPNLSPADLEALQSRIENDGLLFKVRVTSAAVRHRGQEL